MVTGESAQRHSKADGTGSAGRDEFLLSASGALGMEAPSVNYVFLRAGLDASFPAGPIYSSIYMKPAENEDYIPTSLDADLVKLFGATAVKSLITPCEG